MLTRNTTRLALNRDTLRMLTGTELRGVQGGAIPVSVTDEGGRYCYTNWTACPTNDTGQSCSYVVCG